MGKTTQVVIDETNYYECPDENPDLHEHCKMNALYCKQHNAFLSETISFQERLIERLTHVNVAQEITLRKQKEQLTNKQNDSIMIDEFDQSKLRKNKEQKHKSLSVKELLMALSCSDPCFCSLKANDSDIVTMNYNDYSQLMQHV